METPLRLTCLLALDADGERICVKYAQTAPSQGAPGAPGAPGLVSGRGAPRDFEGQRRLECLLHQNLTKIRGRTEAEALQAEGEIGVGLSVGDVSLFAVSPESCANELLLMEVVESLRTVLSSLCQGTVSRQSLIDHLDSVMLAFDEITDQGLLLETNPSVIVARVNMQDSPPPTESASFNQAISQAKDSLIKSLLSGAS